MSELAAISSIPSVPVSFQAWLNNYQLIMSMINSLQLTGSEQKALTQHILRQFSYNAQFSRAETSSLELSRSPFSTQDDNPYLRSSLLPWTDYIKSKICREVGLLDNECKPQGIFFVDNLQCESLLSQHVKLYHISIPEVFLNIELRNSQLAKLIETMVPLLFRANREKGMAENVHQLTFLSLLPVSMSVVFSKKHVIEQTIKAKEFLSKITEKVLQKFQNIQEPSLTKKEKNRIKDQIASYFVIYGWFDFNGQDILIDLSFHHVHRGLINELLGNYGYKPDTIRFTNKFVETQDVFNLEIRATGDLVLAVIDSQIERARQNETRMPEALVTRQELEQLKTRLTIPLPLLSLKSKFNEIRYLSERVELFRSLSSTYARPWMVQFYSHSISILMDKVLFIQTNGSDLYTKYINYQVSIILNKVLLTVKNNEMPKFIQAIQSLVELCQLDLSVFPFSEPDIFRQVVARYFPRDCLQDVDIRSYAMKGFSHILQAHFSFMHDPTIPFKMQIFNQNYFELLEILEEMKEENKQEGMHYLITKVRETDLADPSADLYFLDQHPNNAVEPELFQHNLHDLLSKIFSQKPLKPKTVIVDITLNALVDKDIQKLIIAGQPYIANGWLNLIFVSSLTKFAQLGMDKMSAGLVAYYNNGGGYWNVFNEAMHTLKVNEPVAQLTSNYFAMFFLYLHEEQITYQNKVNSNTQWVYNRVYELSKDLEIEDQHRALTLTMSTDPYTCYIGLNYNDFYNSVDTTFSVSDQQWQEFNQSILINLIMPLARVLRLDLSNRTSFGFPQANISDTANTIRFTLGIEDEPILEQYAEVIAYACFVINRLSTPEKLLDPTFRTNYFQSKINIFRAMSTNDYSVVRWKKASSWENKTRYIVQNGWIAARYYFRKCGVDGKEYYTLQEINMEEVAVSTKNGDELWWKLNSFQRKCISAHLEDLKVVTSIEINRMGSYITSFCWSSFFIRFSKISLPSSYKKVGSMALEFDLEPSTNTIRVKDLYNYSRANFTDKRMVIRCGHKNCLVSSFSPEQKYQFFMQLAQYPCVMKMDRNEKLFLEFLGDNDVYNQNGIRINTKIVDDSRQTVMITLDFWGIKSRDLAGFCRGVLLTYIKDKLKIPFTLYQARPIKVIDCDFKRIYLDKNDMDSVLCKLIEISRQIYAQRNLIKKEMINYQKNIPSPLPIVKTYDKPDEVTRRLSSIGVDEFTHYDFFVSIREKIITEISPDVSASSTEPAAVRFSPSAQRRREGTTPLATQQTIMQTPPSTASKVIYAPQNK